MAKAKRKRTTAPPVDFPGRARLNAERQVMRRAHRMQRDVARLAKSLITVTRRADAALVALDRFILDRVGGDERQLFPRAPEQV